MAVDDVACDRQTETGSSGLQGTGVVETGEPVEYALGVGFGDSGAVISDGEHSLACLFCQRDGYVLVGVALSVLQ